MKIAVRYSSKSGRTKKIADAIAMECAVEALDISVPLNEDVDILFVGSGVYANIVSGVNSFFKSNTSKIGEVVSFSTSAVTESAYPQIKKLAEKNGLSVSTDEFHCPGTFAFRYKNRPNQDDVNNAKDFARKIISK